MPALWRKLDIHMPRTRKVPSSRAIQKYIANAKGSCISFKISGSCVIPNRPLAFIIDTNPALKEIELPSPTLNFAAAEILSQAHNLESLIIEGTQALDASVAHEVIFGCPNLKVVKFSGIARTARRYPSFGFRPNIVVFHYDTQEACNASPALLDFRTIIQDVPNVQDLSLCNWESVDKTGTIDFTSLDRLSVLIVSGSIDVSTPTLPTSIKSLSLEYDGINGVSVLGQIAPLPAGFPILNMLEDLSVWTINGAVKRALPAYIRASASTLKRLSMVGQLDAMLLLKEFRQQPDSTLIPLPVLEELDLSMCGITDDFVVELVRRTPELTTLNLSDTAVSGIAVRAAVTTLEGTLTQIHLNGCHKCSSDAPKWARSKGVRVFYNFPDHKSHKTSRRVRYHE